MHRSSTKICTESMRDKLLTSVLFKFSSKSNLKGSTKNALSWRFFNILKWNFLSCLILHVSCSVEKKTYFIQFSLKNRTLNFSGVSFGPPVISYIVRMCNRLFCEFISLPYWKFFFCWTLIITKKMLDFKSKNWKML